MDITDYLGENVTVSLLNSTNERRIVFLSSGTVKVMLDGKQKLSFLVEFEKRQLNYLPNKTSLRVLADMFGRNTTGWIGKVAYLNTAILNGKEAVIVQKVNHNEKSPEVQGM